MGIHCQRYRTGGIKGRNAFPDKISLHGLSVSMHQIGKSSSELSHNLRKNRIVHIGTVIC